MGNMSNAIGPVDRDVLVGRSLLILSELKMFYFKTVSKTNFKTKVKFAIDLKCRLFFLEITPF